MYYFDDDDDKRPNRRRLRREARLSNTEHRPMSVEQARTAERLAQGFAAMHDGGYGGEEFRDDNRGDEGSATPSDWGGGG